MSRWPPIEANPQVFNDFARQVGVPTRWQFDDVLGFDDELLAMVSQPCLAIIFLFPCKCKTQFSEANRGDKGFFLRQVSELDQACGTIAMIHAIANNLKNMDIKTGVIYDYVNNASKEDTPEKRGNLLVENQSVLKLHKSFANEGQSHVKEQADHHFVCFTEVDGHIYEFDGCKPAPTNHGSLNDTPFLNKVVSIIKDEYMKDPSVYDLAMISFGPVM